MKKIALIHVGDICAATNAAIAGAYKSANQYGQVVFLRGGLESAAKGNSCEQLVMDSACVQQSGSVIGSSLENCEKGSAFFDSAVENLQLQGIDAVIFLGGYSAVAEASRLLYAAEKAGSELAVNVVPVTAKNDVYGTEFCPGFLTAAGLLREVVQQQIANASAIKGQRCINIFEVGANGWICAAALECADIVYGPETAFDISDFVLDTKELLKKQMTVTAIIAEDVRKKDGSLYFPTTDNSQDGFGRKQFEVMSSVIVCAAKRNIIHNVRSVKLDRYLLSSGLVPNESDRAKAFALAGAAVDFAAKGISGVVSVYADFDGEIGISAFDLMQSAAYGTKNLPEEWIVDGKIDKEQFCKYVKRVAK